MGREYFDVEHGGELARNTEVIIAISTTKKKKKSFYAQSSFSAGLGDIISESATRAVSWDQKAQSEVCLLSAAHTVRYEKAQTPRQRGAQVTQPPQGYF